MYATAGGVYIGGAGGRGDSGALGTAGTVEGETGSGVNAPSGAPHLVQYCAPGSFADPQLVQYIIGCLLTAPRNEIP
jgi:hypothetical protein